MDGIFGILESFRGADPTPQQVGAAADRIADVGDGAVPPLLEALDDEDEAVQVVAAAALRRLASPALTQQLMALLRSADVGAMAKALILGLLEDAGMDVQDPSLVGAMVDLQGVLFHGPPGRAGSGSGGAAGPAGDPEGAA